MAFLETKRFAKILVLYNRGFKVENKELFLFILVVALLTGRKDHASIKRMIFLLLAVSL